MHGNWMRRNAVAWTFLVLATTGLNGCLGGGGDEPAGPDTTTGSVRGRIVEPQSGVPIASATVTLTSLGVTATFLESNDESMPPGTYTFDYSVSGDVLTFVDPEGNDTFARCEHGPDNGIEGNWTNSSGGNFNLVLYRGEFAGVGYDGPR